MKLGIFANEDFVQAVNDLLELDLPIKTAYKISKIQTTLAEENKRFSDMRINIVTQYAVKDENGKPITNDKGNIELIEDKTQEFGQKMQELFDIEFEVDTIPLDDLGNINFSPKKLNLLAELITLD